MNWVGFEGVGPLCPRTARAVASGPPGNANRAVPAISGHPIRLIRPVNATLWRVALNATRLSESLYRIGLEAHESLRSFRDAG